MQIPPAYKQNTTGAMTYPAPGTFNRLLFKSPLIWWRMGLGPLLGHSILVVTTWGRKTHVPRYTMLSFTLLEEGQIYVGAGWGAYCDWYRNIQSDPHVTVQIGKRTFNAIARRVTEINEFRRAATRLFETGGDSHFRPYLESLGIEYDLEDMVAKRDRLYQIALDPIGEEEGMICPPPIEADLGWVWGVMAASFAVGWLVGKGGRRRH